MQKGDGSWQNFQLLQKISEKRQNLWRKISFFLNFTTHTQYTINVCVSYKSYFNMVGGFDMQKGDGSWQNFQLLQKISEKRQNLWQKISFS